MKLSIRLMAATLLIVAASGCASPSAYFKDRGRDAMDVFTVSAGLGLEAKARVGPLMVGLGVMADVVGLKGGEAFLATNEEDIVEAGPELTILISGLEVGRQSPICRERKKRFFCELHSFYSAG
jgi:hypothetical protein